MKKKLLLELARHLEEGKLGHKKFDFSMFNDISSAPKCGTAGCAVGELPILFPKKWVWNQFGEPVLWSSSRDEADDYNENTLDDVAYFFDLSDAEVHHLFVPELQETELYGGRDLSSDATRYQVACNIREFIAKKEQK